MGVKNVGLFPMNQAVRSVWGHLRSFQYSFSEGQQGEKKRKKDIEG